MRRLLALLALAACSDPAAKKEAPAALAPEPAPAVDAAPPAPKKVTVPPGAIRLREATVGAAVLLSARLFDLDIVALADPQATASFAIAGREEVGRELASLYGGEAAEKDGLLVIAPAGRASAALAAPGRGRDVDLAFAAAAGDDLARLLADVARTAPPAALGGRFAVAVTHLPAGRMLAMIRSMCAGECTPLEPVALPPTAIGHPRHRLPGDRMDTIRLAGVAVDATHAFAALAGDSAVELAEVGDPVGAADTRCTDAPALGSTAALDRLREAERAVDGEIESLLKEKRVTPGQQVEARKRLAELEEKKAAAMEKTMLEEKRRAPPVWCRELDREELRWRVAAIDSDGVTLEPARMRDADVRSPGPAFAGPPPRRLSISD
jgi:hypothetical protein